MTAKSKQDTRLQREAPPLLIVIGIVVLLAIVGVGGYYAYNGGWKTASQQDEAFKHEMLPIIAAKHGDKAPLEEENRLRQEHGQSPLEIPKEKRSVTDDQRQKLLELQKKLQGGQPR